MTLSNQTATELEDALNAFDAATRRGALATLVERQVGVLPVQPVANMHCHTFFSFNAYGYSPSGLAWLARQRGMALMGIVDFDVLDAVDEFLDACALVGVRGSAGIETRTFVPEFTTREINSPGEPGIYYHMGIGFTASSVPPAAQGILMELRSQAAQRNRDLVARVNRYLAPVMVDYDADVLPLTPSGNATERHIVVAYVAAAVRETDHAAAFWAQKLSMDQAAVEKQMQDSPGFQNLLRSKLMKRGGPGYVQPGHDTFPPVEKLHTLVLACGALPCITWLDGTSAGEQDMNGLLALLMGKGAVALNIVPDRNWNIADPQQAALKRQKLYEVVALAQELDLPLNVGSEMNTWGQKLVDDFEAPALAPVRSAFLDGAYFIYGHTILQRACGLGYQSAWAAALLPTRRERNVFYTAAGKAIPPGAPGRQQLAQIRKEMTPREVLALFEENL